MKRLQTAGIALAIVGASALTFGGCGTGEVADSSLPKPDAPKPSQATTEVPTPEDCIEPACQDAPLTPTPHAVRLTSPQWERTMRDLLKLGALPGSSIGFPADPASTPDRFGGEAGDLIVTTQHWAAYQKAAEALSALVADDPLALAKILPAAAKTGVTAARIAAFVADFLPRAYRRPVTPAEIAALIAVGESAGSAVTSGDPFVNRVKWILTAILQSPKLLYRIALGEIEAKGGRARLTADEIATKLAYGLWGTMPDDGLVAQVKAGKLATKEGVAEVARTMLDDPRAAAAMLEFHDQLYLVDHYLDVKNRPQDLFPKFYADFMKDAQQDMRRTVEELVIKNNGGVKELSTSSVAFVNKKLAPVYGIDPKNVPALAGDAGADTFAKVQLDPSQRKGLLMHAGWLTYEGSPKDPSPIHRGAFVARHVICSPLGSPPPGAAGADPATKPQPTNRLRVEATTKGCGDSCHGGTGGVINPLGFSFEGFDSIGQVRTKDGDFPVDTTGEVAIVGKFAGAVPLFDAVSTNARAHACYAAHWSSYLNGTSFVDVTPKWLSPAVAKSLKDGSVRDIIVELVQTDAFLTVSR
jgi:hypothetical protein